MKSIRALLAILLCAAALVSLGAPTAAAEPDPFYLTARVEGGGSGVVRVYEDSYSGNYYLSLSDLAVLLQGSTKQFRFEYSAQIDGFLISTGMSAAAADSSVSAKAHGDVAYLYIYRNRLVVDGTERRYYTYRRANKDLYMALTDVQLMLDITAALGEDGSIVFDPFTPFLPDPKQLDEEGYFDAVNAVLLGDADTGEILFYKDARRAFPIASLSKLMTYLLLCEAQERGEISFGDSVRITREAASISRGADGTVTLAEGASIPMQELIGAMLLASSNESAAALAAHAAGSTDSFVERMNERAQELEMYSARFYTPHGLPAYSASAVSGKLQNRMSATDMFKLCAYLLEHYPAMTELTSLQFINLPTMKYSSANTNTLVFNMTGISGLKTGSTNRAGYCVAVSMPVTRDGETHNVVLVLLGAETPDLRGQAGEILMRWARAYYQQNDFRAAADK